MTKSTTHPPPLTTPQAPALVNITRFTGKRDTRPQHQQPTWDELVRLLMRHTTRAAKDGPLWSPAAYPDGATRGDDQVIEVTALVFEFDGCAPDWNLLDGVAFVAYSTFSHLTVTEHNPSGGPCWRLVLQLRWPVPREDWRRVWRRARARYAPTSDPACSDASRMYYLPSCPPESHLRAQAHAGEGEPVDADALPETPEEAQEREIAAARPPAAPSGATRDGESVGDRFTRESTWAQLLEPHGWRSGGESRGQEIWRRAGRTDDHEARSANTTPDGNLWVWTSNAPPFEARRSYTKLCAYVLLEHGGDWKAAIKALAARYEDSRAAPAVELGPERKNGHGHGHAAQPDPAESVTLAQVVATFQKWLHLPDPAAVYALLATVVANRLPGDPAWLMLIAGSGWGKTELLQSLRRLSYAHVVATVTEPALLSGTSKKERDADAKGGLLREIGDFGLLVLKDFTSVLSMHREQRGQVLAALREIYDGSWTRYVGIDGGKSLAWEGKLALVAGCTPTIDSHHAVIGAMGERFVSLRLRAEEDEALARQAVAHAGQEATMRHELSAAVAGLFAALDIPETFPAVGEAAQQRIIDLAVLVCRCRSAVERDSHTRDIELIPEREAPSRLALVLTRLFAGLRVLGVDAPEAWRILRRIGMDSMPALRRQVFEQLVGKAIPVTTTDVATAVRYPTQTTRRALEDLAAHQVLQRIPGGEGKADQWELSTFAATLYAKVEQTFPEMSGADRHAL